MLGCSKLLNNPSLSTKVLQRQMSLLQDKDSRLTRELGPPNFEDVHHEKFRANQLILLVVQKSGEKPTWDGAKTLVNNGINYQLINWLAGFIPSTLWSTWICF